MISAWMSIIAIQVVGSCNLCFDKCLLGPGVQPSERCLRAHDWDKDGDVDLQDFAILCTRARKKYYD